MKRTVVLLALVGIAAAAGIGYAVTRGNSSENTSFRLVPVERGDLVSTVNSTGTLGAVSTVQVGTQVSGQIAHLYADFNDRVRQGQLIAQLDTTLLVQAVRVAQADMARAQADLSQKQFLLGQATTLKNSDAMTETDFRAADYNVQMSRAGVTSAQASLERAEQNLQYATIRAPINGVVIERNVDVGQTVAASLSAPQLFLIAEDLSRMQILVSVDESDIGLIHDGQTANFTVQAYQTRVFQGTVNQVRMQSKTTENVVNYTVVVSVSNRDGALLPGMTATVSFEVAKAENVLKVANAALRFRATDEMMAQLRAERAASGDTTSRRPRRDSTAARPDGARFAGGAEGARPSGANRPAGVTQLWYLDASGKVGMLPVRTGITDGSLTEITPLGGRPFPDGAQAIAGITTGPQTATTTNPFQSQGQQQGSRRGPPGAF